MPLTIRVAKLTVRHASESARGVEQSAFLSYAIRVLWRCLPLGAFFLAVNGCFTPCSFINGRKVRPELPWGVGVFLDFRDFLGHRLFEIRRGYSGYRAPF